MTLISDLSQREFAARHRLRLSTLKRWIALRADGSILRLAHDMPAPLLHQLLSARPAPATNSGGEPGTGNGDQTH